MAYPQLRPSPVAAVPWGYASPPPIPPVVEAPGRFHPRPPDRSIRSLAGRASPGRYALGLLIGLPAGLLLLAFEIASRGGFKFGEMPVPAWVVVEFVGIAAALGLAAGASAQSAQRRADGWRDFAGPSPFLLAAAQMATVLSLGLPVAALLGRLDVDTESAVGTLLMVPVYLASYFGLVHFLVVRGGATTWHDVVRPRHLSPDIDDWTDDRLAVERGWRPPISRLRAWLRGPLGDVLLAGSVLIPVLIATGLTNSALLAVLGLNQSDLQSEIPAHPTLVDQALTFLSVAILIPIGEEVFFRGYATNAWGRSLSPTSALVRASLFFAFIHIVNTQNTDFAVSLRVAAFNFVARVPVALALCWIYMRRRSLVASVSLHGFYNGLIVLISFLALPGG